MLGRTLAHYEIAELLGEGGMGAVYRARDTKLGREVALKLLPASMADDPERLARFRREAKVLASLNHPRIAGIHGLEEAGGIPFLVMELAEGEDLARRLERGPLPVDEAVEIARQIAEGLEEAHEWGVVHRDLKPANVMLGPDGAVKILDFGLARAFAGESTGEGDPALSPTITAAMTQAGTILGTAAYMSPEQARGRTVDRRADIWAFGLVLHEMLTGRRAFAGETVSDTIAGILKTEPDWDSLPADLPPHVERVLRRCLEKDPRQRLRDIGEARVRLAGDGGAVADETTASRRARLPWAVTAVAVLVAATALLMRGGGESTRPESGIERVHFTVPIAEPEDGGVGLPRLPGAWLESNILDLSPDGRTLAFLVGAPGEHAVALRPLGTAAIERLPAPDFWGNLAWSQDGKRLAYGARTSVKALPVGGGSSAVLAAYSGFARGLTFDDAGRIVLPPGTDTGLGVAAARSTSLDTLTTVRAGIGERTHRWPDALPEGRGWLFTAGGEEILDFDDAHVAVKDARTGAIRDLAQGTMPRYAGSGHLVFHRGGTLYAAPFDLESLTLVGDIVPMLGGVLHRPTTGAAQYALSDNGVLAWIPGGALLSPTAAVRLDEDGETVLLEHDSVIQGIRIAPDGTRAAMEIDAANANVWLLDLDRGGLSRLTFQGSNNFPRWAPDGRTLYYSSARRGFRSLYRRDVDAGEGDELVLAGTANEDFLEFDLTPDGGTILAEVGRNDGNTDLYRYDIEEGGEARPWVATRFQEVLPAFSPSGRWVAYTSDETGRAEVYLRRWPEGDLKKKVSTGEGWKPRWSADGALLYYVTATAIMRVEVREEPSLELGIPAEAASWSDSAKRFEQAGDYSSEYDVAPDGTLVILRKRATGGLPDRIHVEVGWFDELRRKAPPR